MNLKFVRAQKVKTRANGVYWRENTAGCVAGGSDSSPCFVTDFQCDLANGLHCPGLPFLIYEERVLK